MSNSYKINSANYQNKLSLTNKIGRLIWQIINLVLFRYFSFKIFNSWRIFLLKLFGAKIGKGCVIYSSVKIWAPWNLEIGDFVALGSYVDCYNVDKIIIGSNTTVSQYAYLCSASHDVFLSENPLITAPIIIEDQSWVAADSFISMGVTIGQGAVVGARACVFKNVESWTIVGGNPAKFLKKRILK